MERNTSATTCLLSTRRAKENINPLNVGLEELLKLKPVSYTAKGDKKEHIGLIAEDVFEVEPRLVVLDEGGLPKTIHYEELSALVIKAMQEQQKKIQELEQRIEVLESKSKWWPW